MSTTFWIILVITIFVIGIISIFAYILKKLNYFYRITRDQIRRNREQKMEMLELKKELDRKEDRKPKSQKRKNK